MLNHSVAEQLEDRNRAGRPTKRTPETISRILDLLREGNTRKTAALCAGISQDTLVEWGKDPEFADLLLRAEEAAIANAVGSIQKAAIIEWRAAAWFLERKRPTDWKTLKEPEPQVDLSVLTDDELDAYEAIVTKLTRPAV